MNYFFRILIRFVLLTVILFYNVNVNAHEEPSKTIKEKKDKEIKKKQIVASNIKKATVWKYSFENGAETSLKTKIFLMGYDKQGNLDYIEAYKNDSLQERAEYTYSASGDMLTDIDFSRELKIIEKSIFSYDKEGRVISGVTKNGNDSVTGHFTINHGNGKKSLEFLKYRSDEIIDYKLVYNYPENFDKSDYIEAKKNDNTGKLIIKVTKEYNSAGLPVKKAIFDKSEKLSYSFIYEYDKAGNNIKITKNLADGTIEWEDHYLYDKNGNCTELKSYDKNKAIKTHLIYEFEFYK